jgi:hypothetical protein
MTKARSQRKVVPLPGPLQLRLNQYALGAAAAGVAALAVTPAATAEVIFTPARDKIRFGTQLSLDLNHDGKVDFHLVNSASSSGADLFLVIPHPIGQAGEVLAPQSRVGYYGAAALPAGVVVGPKQTFLDDSAASMAYAGSLGSYGGPWKSATDRYLGLEFKIHGEVHYGWARLTVMADPYGKDVTAKLTGYAYETVANQPIVTGQTEGTYDDASNTLPAEMSPSIQLGLLALGSSAVPAQLTAKQSGVK